MRCSEPSLGIGECFISERFSTKEAASISGAVGAASTTLGIATAATNHNTRHPIVTAAFATTMHRLTGGRFTLGLGRGVLTVVTSLLTAAAVCLTGIIGFVGLVIPHVVRLLVGPDHRRLIPLVAPLGAAFLVTCDYLSRTVFGDQFTVPIGVVTGLFGGPLFIWLLRRQGVGSTRTQ